ncbi:MAG: response regulator [Elusimicrobiota bacterium]
MNPQESYPQLQQLLKKAICLSSSDTHKIENKAAAKHKAKILQNNAKQIRVMIVDDELLTLRTLAALLTEEGYIVYTASNGKEAVGKAQSHYLDIIFMDIKLPGINGVEAFKKIKEIAPQTSVVLMTAYSLEDLIKEAYSEGVVLCLYKPFQIKDVIDIIERTCKK